jgi:hypothetical protein
VARARAQSPLATRRRLPDNKSVPQDITTMKLNHLFTGCAVVALLFAGCKKSSSDKAEDPAPPTEVPSAAISAPTTPAPRTDEPASLKLIWKPGARFVQRMEMTQQMDLPMPIGGKPARQDVQFGQDYALNVLRDRPGGGSEVELEFLAADMSVSISGNEVLGFDTRGEATGDEGNPMVKPLRLMIGQKVLYHLDASNAVERVDGVQALKDKVLGAGGRGQALLSTLFTEEYFKQIMSSSRHLPAEPVKPGAKWPSRQEIVMGPMGKVILNLNYTFRGWDQRDKVRCARLDFTGGITGTGAKNTNHPMASMMSLKDGTTSGSSWFDPARGQIIDTAIRQSVKMEITPPAPAGAPDGKVAPLTTALEQKISVKLLEEGSK